MFLFCPVQCNQQHEEEVHLVSTGQQVGVTLSVHGCNPGATGNTWEAT